MLRRILKKDDIRVWTGFVWVRRVLAAEVLQNGNDHLAFMNDWEALDKLSDTWYIHKDFRTCS
jgi:hypothetical protein